MRHSIRILLFFLLFSPFGKIMGQSFSLSAKQVAMARIKATSLEKGQLGNPSASAFSRGFSGYASIENRFLGTDIQGFAVGAAYSKERIGSFQIGVNRLGIENLFMQELSLGYARKIGSKAAIGGNILIFSRKAAHYESKQAISFNLGTQFALSENIQAGIYLSNPIPDRPEQPSFNFNSEIAAGVTWKLTKLTTAFEIVKPQNTQYAIKTAMDYRPAKPLSIMGGVIITKNDLNSSLGVSYRIKNLELTMASTFHPKLPTGLSFGLRING